MHKFITYRLYFGRKISGDPLTLPNNGNVSDQMLASFLKACVDPAFHGYTVYAAAGCWKGESEKTSILEIMVPAENDALPAFIHVPADIQAVADQYKYEFKQESVMITVNPTLAQF
jgi:hypothetical protein